MSPTRRLNDRHPFELYLLSWALVGALPAALGFTPAPGSVQGQMPEWAARAWAVSLALGAATALAGLAWPRSRATRVSITGLALEQVGLVTTGCATVFYSAAAILGVGVSVLTPVGVTLAFGLASFAQAWKIERALRALRAR